MYLRKANADANWSLLQLLSLAWAPPMSDRDKAAEEYAKYSAVRVSEPMDPREEYHFKNGFLAGADWAEKNSHNTRCGQLAIECDQLKRELNDAKILLEAARNENVQERVIAELKAERDRYREVAEKMAGALIGVERFVRIAGETSNNLFYEGACIEHSSECQAVLKAYAAMKEEVGRD
jgi:hypothetical protein